MQHPLEGRRILVVEDEYFIAVDLVRELEGLGATVVGPYGTVPQAMKAVQGGADLDAAVLDINLRDALIYQVADRLTERSVPLLFATGYDASIIPEQYRDVPRCEKPIAPERVGQAVQALLR